MGIVLEPFVHRKKRYLEIEQWQQAVPDLIAGFTTRLNGRSKAPYTSLNVGFHVDDDDETVKANRQLLAHDFQFPLSRWVSTEQVHGNSIQKVTSADAGKGAESYETALPGIDGIYTAERQLLLTSVYADCVPLYFLAKEKPLVGLAHAGWRGTVKQIAPLMIEKWVKEEKIAINSIEVVIGPCISKEAYEVDQKVIDAVDACLLDQRKRPYVKRTNGAYLLDLRNLNKLLLMQAGLREEQILSSSICTATDARMFSHRHEGGKTGRMMSFIGLR